MGCGEVRDLCFGVLFVDQGTYFITFVRLAVENTEQKNQLFGWNTDNGFYMGRLIQAYGNV